VPPVAPPAAAPVAPAAPAPAVEVQGQQENTENAENSENAENAENTESTTETNTTPGTLEVQGVQASNNAPQTNASSTVAQVPSVIAAGADAIGMDTPVERSLFGMLLIAVGAVIGRFAWTRRVRA
jgi:hypothetical protein